MSASVPSQSKITPSTPEWHVVADLIVVGLGLGTTFPLYLTAVQVARPADGLPRRHRPPRHRQRRGPSACCQADPDNLPG